MTASPGLLGTITNLFSQITGRRRQPSETLPTVNSAAFQTYVNHFNQQVSDDIDRLANKQITIDQWEADMTQEIEYLHTTAYVVAKGGIDQMTQDDLNDIQSITSEQVDYLHQWADQLRQKEQDGETVNYSAMKSRAEMYGTAANTTIEEAAASHMGVDLPFYPGEATICHTNCKCKWRLDKVAGGWDAYWIRAADDSCDTCIAREKACSPLQIRDGVVQPFDQTGTIAD